MCIPFFNVHSERDGELVDVESFLVCVNDYNVGLEVSDTQCRRDGASSRCLPAWQVTVHSEPAGVNIGDDVVDEVVVPPGVSPLVERAGCGPAHR